MTVDPLYSGGFEKPHCSLGSRPSLVSAVLILFEDVASDLVITMKSGLNDTRELERIVAQTTPESQLSYWCLSRRKQNLLINFVLEI